MSGKIEISHYVLETKVLGPYTRSAMWVHGCCFNCKGCLAEEMNKDEPDIKTVDDLVDIFTNATSCEGITISGGEPFLQAGALSQLVKEIKTRRDYGVIVYSGFTLEELKSKNDKDISVFLDQIDILIDGRYMESMDDGVPFRGSSNQRIIMLTDRYKDVFEEYYMDRKKRDIEIRIEEHNVYMVGVPSEYGLKTWKDLKKRAEANVD